MRKFHVPAYFRSFPSIASGQAGAGCSSGPGTGVGFKPARACRRHGWVAVELAADFVFCWHNRTILGAGSPFVREWRLGAEISCSHSFPLISERCLHSGSGRLLAGAWCRGGFETRPCLPGARFGKCRPGAGDGGQGRVLAEVEAGNFCAPLISAQIRHFGVAGHAWALGRRAPGGRSALGVLGTTKHGTPRVSVAVHNWPCRLSGGFMGRMFLSYLCSN